MIPNPILEFERVLVVTVQEDLRDSDALALQEGLASKLETSSALGVLLDLSALEMVDSFLGRLLNDIAVGTRLLGAETVVVGIQPAVAVTLVELGLELRGVRMALNAQKGLALLRKLMMEGPRIGR